MLVQEARVPSHGLNPGLALPTPRTLDGSLEERLAGLAGGHAIVVARSNVPAHEAQTLGDGVNHILALDVVHDTTSTVLIALAARGASQPCTCEHRRRVQTVAVGAQGHAKATTGV